MTEPSVKKLVSPWVAVVKAQGAWVAQDFPPLLDMLATLVVPNNGRTKGGVNDPSTRSVVDVKALDLLMHIQDIVGSWVAEFRMGGFTPDTLTTRVDGLNLLIEARWRTSQMLESDYLRRLAYFDRWAAQIWDLVEPPLQVPLRDATCPECGRAKWANDSEEWVDNLLVSYREGGEVQAECRWASCTFLATGDRALLELGYHVGATVDEETLKDMGVIT